MVTPLMLKTIHKGRAQYVGKVFSIIDVSGDERAIMLHEESGSQQLTTLNSPGGIDAVVLAFLEDHGVTEVHHYTKTRAGEARLYVAPTERLRRKGIRKTLDERDRFFLPTPQWRLHNYRWYRVPWIREERVIDWDDISEQRRYREAVDESTPPEQGTLF